MLVEEKTTPQPLNSRPAPPTNPQFHRPDRRSSPSIYKESLMTAAATTTNATATTTTTKSLFSAVTTPSPLVF